MIATSHVIIGGAVGILTHNPAAAFAAGVASHLICDSLPHLDAPFKLYYKDNNYDEVIWTKKLIAWALIDSLTAFFLTLYIWNQHFGLEFFSPYAWGALGAYLPDVLDVAPMWRDKIRKISLFKRFHKIHLGVHDLWRFKYTMPKYWFLGATTQIIFVIPCLWFILSK